MDDERLEQIRKAFDRIFTALLERDKIMKMVFDPLAKFTGSDAVMSVRKTLEKDPVGEERIFDPNWKLLPYIYLKINSIKKDIEKIKQSKLLARVNKPGDPIINEKKFEAGKFYPVRDVKRIEDLQLEQGKNPITYTIFAQQKNLRLNIVLGNNFNVAMALVAGQTLQSAIQETNQDDVSEKLRSKINELGDKCKNLLHEFLKRTDTSMKVWAQEKGVKYENLKLDYWRCKEKLRQLYFPQSQGMGEGQTA